jgi:hypothetical protein
MVAACSAPSPALPWIHGLASTASNDVEAPEIAERMAGLVGTRDNGGYGGIGVTFGDGSVLASFHQGVIVLDGKDLVIGRAPGFDPMGSADDLLAVAVGDAGLDKPVIVVAVTRGGHRENTTSIVVFQTGRQSQLQRIFDAPVEEHDGDQTFTGSLVFVSQGLVYQRPRGSVERWRFDSSRHRYVPDQPASRIRSPSAGATTSASSRTAN